MKIYTLLIISKNSQNLDQEMRLMINNLLQDFIPIFSWSNYVKCDVFLFEEK